MGNTESRDIIREFESTESKFFRKSAAGKKQLGCYLPHQGQVGEHLGSQTGAGSIIVLRSDRNWPELC